MPFRLTYRLQNGRTYTLMHTSLLPNLTRIFNGASSYREFFSGMLLAANTLLRSHTNRASSFHQEYPLGLCGERLRRILGGGPVAIVGDALTGSCLIRAEVRAAWDTSSAISKRS